MSNRGLDKLLHALQPWAGCWVEPWDYTTSHSWLRIKLQRRNVDACALLAFLGCQRVSFVPSWDGFDLKIVRDDDQHGPLFKVSDGDRLLVECRNVSLSPTLRSYADIRTPREEWLSPQVAAASTSGRA